MPRFALRYALLAVLVVCASWVRGAGAVSLVRTLRDPGASPQMPFAVMSATRTIGSGEFRNDQILALDGKPLTAFRQLDAVVYGRHPGDTIRLTLSRPGGEAIEREVT